MGVRRCLARSLTSLAFRCALQRVQTVPAAIHSGRIPPSQPTSHGDGRLSHPLTTPDMVRSGRVLQPQLNPHVPVTNSLMTRLGPPPPSLSSPEESSQQSRPSFIAVLSAAI